MNASAPARFKRANTRALCDIVKACAMATCRAIGFQICGAVDTQKRARSVSAGVRVLLVADPISLISLKSRVYRGLVNAGGGPGRNCEPSRRKKGCTVPQPGSSAGRNAGGVGIQSPGCEPGV